MAENRIVIGETTTRDSKASRIPRADWIKWALLFTGFVVLLPSLVRSQAPQPPIGGTPLGEILSDSSEATDPTDGLVGTSEGLKSVLAQSAARPFQVGAAGDMIGFSHSDGAGSQTITLIHTGKFWMAVYHIDKSGTIRLVSSRPIDADFTLELNATSPLPEEIRRMMKSSR